MKTLTCRTCGQPFDVKPYRADKAKYCSTDCRDIAYIGQAPAYVPPLNQVECTCQYCGKTFQRIASRIKHGRGLHCSPACQYATIKARPARAEVVQCTCFNCGASFQVYVASMVQHKGRGKYCSRPCRDAHRHGLNHPQYIDGGGDDRGPNWQAQRRKALKRDDYTCQECGRAGTDVHHIKPFRLFGMERYQEANDLSNLVALCDPCHRVTDAEIQRTERV